MLCAQSFSCVHLFVTPWTVASRLLCPWGFSRQEYWSGLPCPPLGNLPNPGIEPRSPTLQTDSLPSQPQFLTCQGKTLKTTFLNSTLYFCKDVVAFPPFQFAIKIFLQGWVSGHMDVPGEGFLPREHGSSMLYSHILCPMHLFHLDVHLYPLAYPLIIN